MLMQWGRSARHNSVFLLCVSKLIKQMDFSPDLGSGKVAIVSLKYAPYFKATL